MLVATLHNKPARYIHNSYTAVVIEYSIVVNTSPGYWLRTILNSALK